MKQHLVAVATAAYCASPGAQQPSVDPTWECQKTAYTSESFAPLKDKIPPSSEFFGTFSPAALTDKGKPSARERKAISAFVIESQRCFGLGNEWRNQRIPPQIQAAYSNAFTAQVLRAVDLYDGKLTYGQFNRARFEAIKDIQQQVSEFVAELRKAQLATAAAASAAKAEREAAEQQARSAAEGREREQLRQAALDEQAQRRQIQAQEDLQRRQLQAQQDQQRRAMALQYLLRGPSGMPNLAPLPAPKPVTNTVCRNVGSQVECTTQ